MLFFCSERSHKEMIHAYPKPGADPLAVLNKSSTLNKIKL